MDTKLRQRRTPYSRGLPAEIAENGYVRDWWPPSRRPPPRTGRRSASTRRMMIITSAC